MSPRSGGGVAIGYGLGSGGGYVPAAQQQGVLFHSDWSTGTGTGDDALRDTAKDKPWDVAATPGLQVVNTGISLGFPTTNVLRVYGGPGVSSASRVRIDGQAATPIIPAFNVGVHQYWRWYWKYELPISNPGRTDYDDSGDPSYHPNETYGGGTERGGSQANWSHVTPNYDPSTETWETYLRTNGAAFPNDQWWPDTDNPPVDLDANEVYRFEVHLERVSNDFFHLEARLYNSADALLYSESQWRNQQQTQTSADGVNLGQPGGIVGDPWFHHRSWHMGINGWTGAGPSVEMTYCYIGAVALRDDDWCGPYSGGI